MSDFLPLHPLRTAAVLPVLALLLAGAGARAQDAGAVTYDAEIPLNSSGLATALATPGGMALTANGTLYVTDGARVVQIVPAGTVGGGSQQAGSLGATMTPLTSVKVSGNSVALNKPTALAVDSQGDLYIADTGLGEVLELTNPSSGAATKVTAYTGTDPVALAVDPSNDLYIADYAGGNIYEISNVAGGLAGTLANTIAATNPVGLATDASGNLYYAEATGNDNIYEYANGKSSTFLSGVPENFNFPANNGFTVGMGFDPAGNFYVLSSGSEALYEFPWTGASISATPYQIPLSTSTEKPKSIAVGAGGTLYLSDDTKVAGNYDTAAINPAVYELFYQNSLAGTESTPVNFGSLGAGTNSPYVTVNYLFNQRVTAAKAYQSMQGDNTGEFKNQNDTACVASFTAGETCSLEFYVDYQSTTPGLRRGVYGLTDSAGAVFAIPTIGISQAGALAVYPGVQTRLAQPSTPFLEPEGLAISGNGGLLFVADEGGNFATGTYTGAVWMYNLTSGAAPTQVGPTGALAPFLTPMAVALDPAGNLYVADYSTPANGSNGYGNVTVIPPANGSNAPYSSAGSPLFLPPQANGTAVTLYHPMSLAFDPEGNLFIGDMGPSGIDATADTPGFIVEVPAGGGPAVKLNATIGGVPIVFPQALTTDQYGNLFIADGGDENTDPGGVDVIATPVLTSTAAALPSTSLNNLPPGDTSLNQPGALSFDAAGDLYVLDSYNLQVDVYPITYSANGTSPTASAGNVVSLGSGVSGITASLVTPSSLVVWPTGNTMTITDLGFQDATGVSNSAFGITLSGQNSVAQDASSNPAVFYGVNVGNLPIKFSAPLETVTSGGGGGGCMGFGCFGGGGGNNNGSFTLSGCGSSTTTLATGVMPFCTPTITYTSGGTGSLAAYFTLKSTLANDNSLLGNNLYVTAEPSEPIAALSGPNSSFDQTITVTLTNSGSTALDIYSITLTRFTYANGGTTNTGTCPASGTLAANSSCTLIVEFTNTQGGFFGGRRNDDSTIKVADDSENNTNATQTFTSVEIRGFGFF